ncbi:MAG: TRAP transporter small permease [Alphaproteobacteria bacterium]|nr:TRAP transporter small permease [Alphaproteobacteria bacterium]
MTDATMPEDFGGRAIDRADRVLALVELALAAIAGLVIFCLMFAGVAEILMRRLYNAPIYGHLDAVEQSMITFTVLSISYCWRRAQHVRMDLLIGMFKGRARWIAELLAVSVGLLFLTLLIPGTWQYFHNAWSIGDTTMNVGMPTWPSKLAVPIGLGVLWLRLVIEAIAYVRLIIDPMRPPVGIPTPPDPINEAVD